MAPDLLARLLGSPISPVVAAGLTGLLSASIANPDKTLLQHVQDKGELPAFLGLSSRLWDSPLDQADPEDLRLLLRTVGLEIDDALPRALLHSAKEAASNPTMSVSNFVTSGEWKAVRNQLLKTKGPKNGDVRWCPYCQNPMFSIARFKDSEAVEKCPNCGENIFLEKLQ